MWRLKPLFMMVVLLLGQINSVAADEIRKKDGSIIKGQIIEEIPQKLYRIKTPDGTVSEIKYDNVSLVRITSDSSKSVFDILLPFATLLIGFLLAYAEKYADSIKKKKNMRSLLFKELKENFQYLLNLVAVNSPQPSNRNGILFSTSVYNRYLDRIDVLGKKEVDKIYDANLLVSELMERIDTLSKTAIREFIRKERYVIKNTARAIIEALENFDGGRHFLIAILDNQLDDSEASGFVSEVFSDYEGIAQQSVPVLIEALHSDNRNRQNNASRAMGRLGRHDNNSAQALMRVLKHNNPEVRKTACLSLGQIGNVAEIAVPELIALLKSPIAMDKINAATALGNIGSPVNVVVPALLETLHDDYFEVRAAAAMALSRIGKDAVEAIPALIDALGDEFQNVIEAAAEALAAIGETAVPELVMQFREDVYKTLPNTQLTSVILNKVVQILSRIGVKAIPALADAVYDRNAVYDFSRIVSVLATMGEPAVPLLIEILNWGIVSKEEIYKALGDIGKPTDVIVPRLISDLIGIPQNEEDITRLNEALCTIGKPAVPSLIKVIKSWIDESSDFVMYQPTGYIPASIVAMVLGNIGKPARAAVPTLLRAIDVSINKGVVIPEFFIALGQIGEPADIIIQTLGRELGGLTFHPAALSEAAIQGLTCMGEKSVPVLVDALNFPNLEPSLHQALAHIGEPAIRRLIDDLNHEYGDPYIEALVSIGDPAVPFLTKALESNLSHVSHHAETILRKIGTPRALKALRAIGVEV